MNDVSALLVNTPGLAFVTPMGVVLVRACLMFNTPWSMNTFFPFVALFPVIVPSYRLNCAELLDDPLSWQPTYTPPPVVAVLPVITPPYILNIAPLYLPSIQTPAPFFVVLPVMVPPYIFTAAPLLM